MMKDSEILKWELELWACGYVMSKFYAVKIGRNPGIYNSWSECQQQVNGFKGAIFKSFKTKEEADNFINGEDNKK